MLKLKPIMLEEEMEEYLLNTIYKKDIMTNDEENVVDCTAVTEIALAMFGYQSYTLHGMGDLNESHIFIQVYKTLAETLKGS